MFIHNRIKDGTIPAVKISGIVRIRIEDVEDLLRHSQIVPPRDLNPDDRAFIAELVANAPALSLNPWISDFECLLGFRWGAAGWMWCARMGDLLAWSSFPWGSLGRAWDGGVDRGWSVGQAARGCVVG